MGCLDHCIKAAFFITLRSFSEEGGVNGVNFFILTPEFCLLTPESYLIAQDNFPIFT